MKKKSLLMVLVLMVAAAIAGYGAAAGPIVADKSVPADQCGTLMVINTGNVAKITKFNGKGVSWKPSLLGAPANVLIPAGTHSLRIFCQEENIFWKTSGSADITNTFVAGRTYLATVGILKTGKVGKKVQAYILDITPDRDIIPPNHADPNASPFEGEWVRSAEGPEGVAIPIQLFITGDQWTMKQSGQFTSRGYVLQKNIWGIAVTKYPNDDEKVLFITERYNMEEKKWELPITILRDKNGKEKFTLYNFTIVGNDFVTCDGTLLSLGNEANTKNIAVKIGDPSIGVYTRAK